jgi:sortase A
MGKKRRSLGARAAVVALCSALLVVIGGGVPVLGRQVAYEAKRAGGGVASDRGTDVATDEGAGKQAASERRAPRNRGNRGGVRPASARSVRPMGPPEGFDPPPGQVVFRMRIPAIGLRETVVQGVEASQLARGPGHYPECGVYFAPPYCSEFEQVWPGEVGRTVIGGHRTLANADFFDLGELRAKDEVRVRASWGDFTYRVTRQEIVDDGDRSVIVPGIQQRELVLVTCHPKFSSAQRLITYARLVPPPNRAEANDSKRRSPHTAI